MASRSGKAAVTAGSIWRPETGPIKAMPVTASPNAKAMPITSKVRPSRPPIVTAPQPMSTGTAVPTSSARYRVMASLIEPLSPEEKTGRVWRDGLVHAGPVERRGPNSGRGRRVAAEAVMEIEAALEPVSHRIVVGENPEGADDARPLQRAEHDVIGVKGALAADEGLALQDRPEREERLARGFEALLAALLHGLQTAPEALLAALPEIDLVLLGQGVVDVLDAERDELGMRAVRPGLDEARHGLAAFAAEQRRAIRVGLFEIERDVEAVAHDSSAILDHGHGLLAAADRFDPCEGRRLRLEGEALVRQRHLGPPAIGAEAAPVGCREVVKHDRHAHPLA